MSIFQRRHYRWIADTIAGVVDVRDKNFMCDYFMYYLRRENPQFKPDRFRKACKVDDTIPKDTFDKPYFGEKKS